MRYAFSAVAGTSGLLLLGLAFYGQPALYVQQAREEWVRLFNPAADQPASDLPADPDRDVVAEQMDALQRQIARLKDELAARQTAGQPFAATAPPPSTVTPQPVPSLRAGSPAQPEGVAALPSLANPPPAASLMTQSPVVAAAPPAQPTVNSAPPPAVMADARTEARKPDWLAPPMASLPAEPTPPAIIVPQRRNLAVPEPATIRIEPQRPEPAKTERTKIEQSQVDGSKADNGRTELARLDPGKIDPGKIDPGRPDIVKPDSGRSDIARIDGGKSDTGRIDSAKADTSKPEAGKPDPGKPPQKLAAAKPAPPPPPLPSPSRQDVDDTQSVLARLRQIAPPSVQQPETFAPAEPKQAEPRVPAAASPSLPKLTAARTALAGGRIDEARRLLQEAQLQLVFRPVNISGDEQPMAGRGAADVAHALEALSANNVSLSRRYIDVAMDDLSGNGSSMPAQASDLRATGYAPAYPPR